MPEPADSDYLIRWKKWTDLPLLILAIGSLPLLLLDFKSDRLTELDTNFLFAVNVAVFVAFAIDYVVELMLSKRRLHYIKTEWASFLIVIAQLLALLPSLGFLGVLRGVRALRVIGTLTRLVGIGVAIRGDGKKLFKKHAASLAFGISGFTLISSAVAFTLAENVGKEGRIGSFFDALWWAAATITTVGYGDIYPITSAGRVIAVFTMVVGISTLAVVTARIAQFLMRSDSN
ncbi:MAG: potassium channel family protein [Acidimicrobiaceae bacterium]|nr:potassium channel family protein [Acidimicrobiaceae bacterium]